MKKKNKKQKLSLTIKDKYYEFKDNPKQVLINFMNFIKKKLKNNKIFILFIILNVLNGLLLRSFTLGAAAIFAFDALLADLGFVIIIGSFSFFFKNKGNFIYLFIWTLILSTICVINSAYYTFYTSFSSISLISTARFITSVGDAVVENVLQPKDLVYALMPIILLFFNRQYKKNGYYKTVKHNNVSVLKSLALGVVTLLIFAFTLTATDIGRLTKNWNREYVVTKFGIYVYHVNDLIKSLEPKFAALFGYDEALKEFNEYYANVEKSKTNEYTGIFEGKNIIAIHAESMQSFVIGMKFNGIEVTPNLNKLANESLYFENFYTQVSVGTSSDTEFTLNTSLMPANLGTAFGDYFDKEYVSIPKLLKEKGYYSFAMHGNNGEYWNRRTMHQNLGYDYLYAKDTYVIDETIGLGLSDVSFFKQSVEKLVEINKEKKNYYGNLIMLTNHTPFSETDKYGEFAVDIKETITDEFGNQTEISYPYMEGTKLGNYLKSVHYADYALGIFLEEMKKNGLLENTVIVLYGDHDARLPESNFKRLYNYDKTTDGILSEEDPNYVDFNEYSYELNRKVPLIIWSKTQKDSQGKEVAFKPQKISYITGMYDVMPTLGNMFGFYNKYALGHDIFSIKEKNIVVFPTGNWLTKDMYYNNQKEESYILNNSVISSETINSNTEYADKLLSVSNDILVFDLIKNSQEKTVNENEIVEVK